MVFSRNGRVDQSRRWFQFQASRAVTRAYTGGKKRGLPMEEDKAAAYYDELSRKGEGAARFKQGLGFSSSSSAPDLKRPPSAAASFLSNFVRASSPGKATEIQKEAQLERIQNKLKKKPTLPSKLTPSGDDGDADWRRRRRSRSRSRSRSRERYRNRRRSPNRQSDRSPRRHHSHGRRREDEDEEKYRSRRRRRSRSRSGSEERERSRQSRHGDERERGDYSSRRGRGSKSPPSSPKPRAAERGRRDVNGEDSKKRENDKSRGPHSSRERISSTDYSQLIAGYSQMLPRHGAYVWLDIHIECIYPSFVADFKIRGHARMFSSLNIKLGLASEYFVMRLG
ncbi:hypothetical protein Taro_018636 [Colocasia esculenta]|uniref:Uncharacterized protein n=1 Tax=Colocasia esculenta TaxID=4460 RepID=A0A843URX8_COLES|nr:hypothetical protein [Colocasia esculenta]